MKLNLASFKLMGLWLLIILSLLIPYLAQAKKYSAAPIIGYNSTYSLILGAALFKSFEEEKNEAPEEWSIALDAAKGSLFEGSFEYEKDLKDKKSLSTTVDYSNFFHPYYGEGIKTDINHRVEIRQSQMVLTLKGQKEIADNQYLGLGLDFRRRKEKKDSYFPNESSLAPKISYELDTRDESFFPHEGHWFQAELLTAPSYTQKNYGKKTNNFYQLSTDERFFYPLAQTVLALHLNFSTSLGRPSYLYRYSLGGEEGLRGHETNRFRGRHLSYLQIEERIPFFDNHVEMIGFYELGSVSDESLPEFKHFKQSKGLGLRVTLPPDHIAKVRLDVGFGSDQYNINLEFNENF